MCRANRNNHDLSVHGFGVFSVDRLRLNRLLRHHTHAETVSEMVQPDSLTESRKKPGQCVSNQVGECRDRSANALQEGTEGVVRSGGRRRRSVPEGVLGRLSDRL